MFRLHLRGKPAISICQKVACPSAMLRGNDHLAIQVINRSGVERRPIDPDQISFQSDSHFSILQCVGA